jgi:hypothetical protein
MTDEEQRMSFHEYTEHIMRKGEARERAQSILRERQSIMTIAADLLPPERIEQLQSMQDLDLLTKAIQAALRERVR